MDEVLPNLYVGGFAATKIPSLIKKNNIQNCVSISEEGYKEYEEDSVANFKYWKRICVADSPTQDIAHLFQRFIMVIHECLCHGEGVLVHCKAGVSRSPTIVIAYLMTCASMSYADALSYVQSCRPMVNPNPGFRRQLAQYEQRDLLEVRRKTLELFGGELFEENKRYIAAKRAEAQIGGTVTECGNE